MADTTASFEQRQAFRAARRLMPSRNPGFSEVMDALCSCNAIAADIEEIEQAQAGAAPGSGVEANMQTPLESLRGEWMADRERFIKLATVWNENVASGARYAQDGEVETIARALERIQLVDCATLDREPLPEAPETTAINNADRQGISL